MPNRREPCIILSVAFAGVLELADEVDSKSIASNGVRVQVPPPAPQEKAQHCRVELSCCAFCFIYDIFYLLLIATHVKIIMIIVEYNIVQKEVTACV